ncbi:LysR family transcriptional regulator (plasmid) [Rhodococcus sp. USK10]|uniref:LysR family transcriptional regulator n=1 Tax=Rhodococcus sp. USK10 TaxID=2789739 RepID=UPI001C5D9BB0|nr:LysR family transcriptional regulator [Rhodococcus sp. USK10]QYB00245.1 LysR family transcriptional regulator [Rhodococcus sp. USK10]
MADIDLNLVRTFILLYQNRSVTRTAAELSVTQPSVSHGLKRLRRHFADDLFVRSATGLKPTQVATRLYPELQQALEVIDSAVRAVSTFDAKTSTRTFRLLATDLGETLLLPAIAGLLRERAPSVKVEVEPLDFKTFEDDLRQNRADGAICTPRVTADDLNRDVLRAVRYVGLCAARHKRIGAKPSMNAFLSERHVAVTDASGHMEVDRALAHLGSKREVAIRVPHFAPLPGLVQETDLLAIIPDGLSDWFFGQSDVRTFALPFSVRSVEVSLYTYRKMFPSPAADWFRALVREALGEQCS